MSDRSRFFVLGAAFFVRNLSAPSVLYGHDADKLGIVNFPVSCSAEAQQGFNRAVAMLHNFWFPQAGNAFGEITKAEPGCAMAYWGLAMSLRANPLVGQPTAGVLKSGWEAVEKAKAAGAEKMLPRRLAERERDYIAAIEEYYKDADKTDFQTRVLAYEKAMERLHSRYPEDIEAASFYALALNEAITALPADKTYSRHLKAAEIAQKVLAKQPDHPGGLHYLIHSYDFPALANRGVTAANQYASVAPSAPHALHMPSHVYSMLGMWEESIRSNLTAVGVAKSYVHAMDFMAYAYLQLGQERQAERLMNEAGALQKAGGSAVTRSPTGAALTVHTAWAAIPARFAIERGAWAEAAALELKPTSPPADAITHFTRAMGFAQLGDAANARKEIERLQSLREELLNRKDNYWAEQVDIQHKAAKAWVAHKEGKKADAIAQMRSAADLEDASEKHVAMENRLWPMRELLGELLLALNQPGAALKEFETSLADSRNRLRGFHGAAKAAEMAGDRHKAAEFYRKLVALTAKADSDRKEVQQAKAFLAIR
jgi:tetratricopeptide (TPR) repeat protein